MFVQSTITLDPNKLTLTPLAALNGICASSKQNSGKATGRERKVGREGEREKESLVVQSIYVQVGTNKSASWTL